MDITISEYFAISRDLEDHHALFYKMWELGVPVFSQQVPTAAIMFNRDSGEYMQYHFNPDFWEKLTPYQRLFVICHETLHVILNHGIRTTFCMGTNPQITNQALDIVVNETLLNKFNFDRAELGEEFLKDLCVVDTIFGPDSGIPVNECFEYYYDKMNKMVDEMKEDLKGMGILDNHDHLPGTTNQVKDILRQAVQGLQDEDCNNLANVIGEDIEADSKKEQQEIIAAGNMAGNGGVTIKIPRVIKRKWETVISKWSRQFKDEYREIEQWTRKNRRIFNLTKELILPSEIEDEYKEKTMIDVWFFQDTSGSCQSLAPRFFKAAGSLPPDKFNVKLHCFDTQVYETSLKSGKLYGFGGTTFTCIENYIQSEMKKNNLPYPKAVFVITDGYGDKVQPEFPNKWYWFLSENYKGCIPKECNTFMLKDYE